MPKVIYREVQKPQQIWIWLIIMFIAAIAWYGFIQQIIIGIPFGNKPAPDVMFIIFWLIFGIAFPLVHIFYIKLITEVREDGVYIRFMPFHFQYRKFLYDEITHYETTEYSPMEFGGWGIRVNAKGGTAYCMSGQNAVEIQLKNKETVVIGSQNPDEIIKAIDSLVERG